MASGFKVEVYGGFQGLRLAGFQNVRFRFKEGLRVEG